MSHLVLTAAFGPAARYHSGPKHVMVFGQRVVGGSGVYLFNHLGPLDGVDTTAPALRLRADDSSVADALMAGFLLAEPTIPLAGEVDALARCLRAEAKDRDVEISTRDAITLAEAAADVDVSLLITLVEDAEPVAAEHFRGWPVAIVAAP